MLQRSGLPVPTMLAVLLSALLLAHTESGTLDGTPSYSLPSSSWAPWPRKVISWWYASGSQESFEALIEQIKQPARLPLVTSVQTYCGHDVSDDGKIIMNPHQGNISACIEYFPRLAKLGVRPELATGAGNCSIVSYRKLWTDTTESPQALLQAALAVNASGWNIDLEPQGGPDTGKPGWGCQGGSLPKGNASDARLFAGWLSAVRAVLNPHGIRLTVDVASWSPVLREYATLAPAVDRLQTMSTYNGAGFLAWDVGFREFIHATPISAAGIGLGVWNDTKHQWWESPAGAKAKVAAATASGVRELACFRLIPSAGGGEETPANFWWEMLDPFLKDGVAL
jgi:hypothetical protein